MSDKLDEIKEEEKEIDQAKDGEEFICQNEFVDTMITNQSITNSSFFLSIEIYFKIFFIHLISLLLFSSSYINQPCENHLEIIS